MKPSNARYWTFQIVGWGVYALISIFFAIVFDQLSRETLYRVFFFVEIGIILSHFMRIIIRRSSLLLKSLQQQVVIFIILTIAFAILVALIQTPFEQICDLWLTIRNKKAAFHKLFFYNFSTGVFLLVIWNLIYFMYHYIVKSRKQQMDTLQLEALVKELELKTIKAHINPHFIFNALNSIRALIDENPARARTAVTELSNILRSSLKIEKGGDRESQR